MIDWSRKVTEASRLQAARACMVCTPLQGRYVLGEDRCNDLDAVAADPEKPWALRQAISYANNWYRTSQSMTVLAYLLGYSEEQMDALFVAAMKVDL